MKNFTVAILSAALLCGSVSAQKADSPANLRSMTYPQSVVSLNNQPQAKRHTAKPSRKASRMKTPVFKEIAAPDENMKPIETAPDGTLTECIKDGFGFAYSWYAGLIIQPIYNGLTTTVVSPDKKHLYVKNPIFFNIASADNWLVADLDGDKVTFKFPQLADIDIYTYEDMDEPEIYYDYALVLEFKMLDEETEEGTYVPTASQTYTMTLNADGSLTPDPECDNLMIGVCEYITEEEAEASGQDAGYSWIGTGDIYESIRPLTEKVPEYPADLTYEDWTFVEGLGYSTVKVAVKGDTMYFKGLFENVPEAVVVGKINGDKVTCESGQYLGVYKNGNTLIYFLGGDAELVEDDYDVYYTFTKEDNIVFNYDKDSKKLVSSGAYCISCSPDEVLYYIVTDDPELFVADKNHIVKTLIEPELEEFYEVNEEYDYDAEMYFTFPSIDNERQPLALDRLFYQAIVDDEIYTFYNDEYELPAGVEETTEIPFGYNSEEDYDFYALGLSHGFVFKARDFESFGIRTLYKPLDGETLYSSVLWAPGYEGTFPGGSGVNDTLVSKSAKSIEYFDLAGRRIDNPTNGIFVKRSILSDGSVRVAKVVKK